MKNVIMNRMKNKNVFLSHLYELLRRKIAICYAQHEMRKLLPKLREASLWRSIDKQIRGWYEELSIRNFWNGIHGISMGFRLKSLVPWITSVNIKWEEKNVPVKELNFGGKFSTVYLKSGVLKTAPRDHFPIFVLVKKGKLVVIDGNRRLLKAIADKKDTISAFVGKPIAKPVLYEHWVPTSILVDLVFWHEQQALFGREITETIARTIAELIRDSSAGRIEFAERAIHKDDEIHMRLLLAVTKILASYGVSLGIKQKRI